jgi:hypothetical protein
MSSNRQPAIIELGNKVSVRRNGQFRIGIVTSLADEYVTVRWTNLDFSEIAEYQAHRDDVTPLAGWVWICPCNTAGKEARPASCKYPGRCVPHAAVCIISLSSRPILPFIE